ncbi:hypothetical protein IP92_01213 [Pseudoduganella flava]|uniref:Uncharacterized protein n=1 Tax=Pseudoduganella flava TaxID=871742 RepID=A0A562PZY7_9BURK|nr:hypothetical protein [Pseudoduganella flava]QGZ38461.1 hypothetical protein GO485_04935 [Pseudoduganella flava]TWI49989.1 hypothetical protein IP92_01213 [Pseudoduganella flava]
MSAPHDAPSPSSTDTLRFRRRLLSLAIVAVAGMALLTARLIWLQAIR